jgi:hypothetical protein
VKKVALVFVTAVIVPSLVLAWLAIRSVRDQQYALERQRSLLYQGVADGLAKEAQGFAGRSRARFRRPGPAAAFDPKPTRTGHRLRRLRSAPNWPLAQVACAVTVNGEILSPSPLGALKPAPFLAGNAKFLVNRESAEVYWNYARNDENTSLEQSFAQNNSFSKNNPLGLEENNQEPANNAYLKKAGKAPQMRNVVPQQQALVTPGKDPSEFSAQQYSKLSCTDAEFRQLIGDQSEGTLARFLDNKLNVLCWYHPRRDTNFIFVAQLALPLLKEQLKGSSTRSNPPCEKILSWPCSMNPLGLVAVSRPRICLPNGNIRLFLPSSVKSSRIGNWRVYLLDSFQADPLGSYVARDVRTLNRCAVAFDRDRQLAYC